MSRMLFAVGVYYFDKEYAEFVFNTANVGLGTLVIMVAAFYFSGYYINQYNKRKKEKDK